MDSQVATPTIATTRGRRAHPWEEGLKSITEMLGDPAVVNFVTGGRAMTPGSQRERIRKLLNLGKISPEEVAA